ncbi:MAG: MarR family transcriptional regulator [Patescibacteria group bacterium]|nr:MarR family transcriptional regulator [Patescibacteria group bacterium]
MFIKKNIDKELFETIFNVYKIMKKNYSSFKEIDLSMVQLHGLMHIFENPGCSLKELAERFSITNPSANDLTEKLINLKLIKREEDKKDRRIIHLNLTEKGKKIVNKILKQKNNCFSFLIKKLSSKEKEQLLLILKKIIN